MPVHSEAPAKTTLPTSELNDLMVCAFRYALGRRTYATSTVSELVEQHWAGLPVGWRELVHREVREAVAAGCAGDACDVASWKRLLELPIR
ncbi:hypothetical protein [Hymenobacter psychrophilus]|uniref:Uncharacterized protein n=1 Tax=Hymenobacter psychrophilus TaxID=651662 RepID=A0A1H3PA16_9BACT|nr:hypothetical protein [Hymenobacter psychrophilus]SDY97966.1 hypothetical protein SAMN04488069_1265 [Hymenobacter psychrophilus]